MSYRIYFTDLITWTSFELPERLGINVTNVDTALVCEEDFLAGAVGLI